MIKSLKTDMAWTSQEAEGIARDAIPEYLTELYSLAMAGLFLYPHCTELYTTLCVGVFYTQLRWNREEDDEIRSAVQLDFLTPNTKEEREAMVAQTGAAIEECRTRKMPSVVC